MLRVVLPAALFSTALAGPAFAYLDPGTGSIIVQGIIGGLAVAGATVSVYWQRVRAFFSSRSQKTDSKK